jgi:hypothetical protein
MEFKDEIKNECAFHISKKDDVCSPEPVLNKLKLFAAQIAGKPQTPKMAIEVLKFRYDCKSESCILNKSDVKDAVGVENADHALKNYFKPSGPRLSFEWLSNFDIDKVLTQIQKKYEKKHFLHIPFQMRDFNKTGSELSQLDWQTAYNKGFRTFGTVVNTDYSSGNGIHWFALFGDFLDDSQTFTIEYFNSSGDLPLPEINIWMKKLKHLLKFDKEVVDVVVTRIENQSDGHSCGPYSLYYIISRLDGVPYTWFKKNSIGDEKMHLFRQYLFRMN